MQTRVTNTTEETDDPADVQPINVSFYAPEDREVQMRVASRARPLIDAVQVESPRPTALQNTNSSLGEFVALSGLLQSWQNTQQQQSSMLRDLDNRLARMEDRFQPLGAVSSVQSATWWLLWGVLMVIFGAALLVVVLLLVTRSYPFVILP
jgi:hypothetical protein